jgi:hypothetical protein
MKSLYEWLRDPPHWWDNGLDEYRPRLGVHFKSSVSGSQIYFLHYHVRLNWTEIKWLYGYLRRDNGIWQSLFKLCVLNKKGSVAYNQEVKYYLW